VDAAALSVHLAEAALAAGDLDAAACHAYVTRLVTARPLRPRANLLRVRQSGCGGRDLEFQRFPRLVIGDPATGTDLAEVVRDGRPQLLSRGTGDSPQINDAGQITDFVSSEQGVARGPWSLLVVTAADMGTSCYLIRGCLSAERFGCYGVRNPGKSHWLRPAQVSSPR
jgi:hypothetical protein